ncbi:MAG: GNAT family N-acetyltransferase [Succinivibrio sp.]|nr:GNAT family N-acetyltransferase [Succinivibrio sp.]
MISIRRASPQDIRAIHDLSNATLPNDFSGVLDTELIDLMFERLYSQDVLQNDLNSGQIFFVVSEDEKDCGYASVIEQGPDLFLLPKIMVDKAHRHHGIGTALFNQITEYIKTVHPKTCTLELLVSPHNRAYGFYEQMGMKKIRETGIDIEGFYLVQDVLAKEI